MPELVPPVVPPSSICSFCDLPVYIKNKTVHTCCIQAKLRGEKKCGGCTGLKGRVERGEEVRKKVEKMFSIDPHPNHIPWQRTGQGIFCGCGLSLYSIYRPDNQNLLSRRIVGEEEE